MILFVVTDAGPAKYISTIIKNINYTYVCISSTVSKKVFDFFKIKNSLYAGSLELKHIELIVTGTCLGDCLEKNAIQEATKANIPSISIIEHWSLYKERFKLNDYFLFPDYIFVNDYLAKTEAILDGIEEDKIVVVGNPYLEFISKKVLQPQKKSLWCKKYNFTNRPVITFISEIYKNDFPKESINYPGFDEYQVLGSLLEVANKIHYNVLIRLHPSENKNKYNKYLLKNVALDMLDDYDSTIINSDFIVGMGSMFLIEAALFRNNVISYRPNEKIPFIGNKLGLTIKVTDKENLYNLLIYNSDLKTDRMYKEYENSIKRIKLFFNKFL